MKQDKRKTQEFRTNVSNALKAKWQDPEYRAKCLIHLDKLNSTMDRSAAGKKSRLYENKIAEQIVADKVYLPNEVCDRIVVRDGKVFFVEIKRKDRKQLKPKQEEFKSVAKDSYEILYG